MKGKGIRRRKNETLRVIDKIKTETAVMKRVLSTVDSWCVTDGVRKEKERLTAALRENHMRIGG